MIFGEYVLKTVRPDGLPEISCWPYLRTVFGVALMWERLPAAKENLGQSVLNWEDQLEDKWLYAVQWDIYRHSFVALACLPLARALQRFSCENRNQIQSQQRRRAIHGASLEIVVLFSEQPTQQISSGKRYCSCSWPKVMVGSLGMVWDGSGMFGRFCREGTHPYPSSRTWRNQAKRVRNPITDGDSKQNLIDNITMSFS